MRLAGWLALICEVRLSKAIKGLEAHADRSVKLILVTEEVVAMQINSISTTTSPYVTSAAGSAAAPAKAAPAGSTTSAATAPVSAAATSGAAQAAAPSQSVAAAVSTATSLLENSYSTSAGGKNYSASISQTDGIYTLSVPNLPGSSVTGSSLAAAENALNLRIDILV